MRFCKNHLCSNLFPVNMHIDCTNSLPHMHSIQRSNYVDDAELAIVKMNCFSLRQFVIRCVALLTEWGSRNSPEVGDAAAGETAKGHNPGMPWQFHTVHQARERTVQDRVCHFQSRPERKDAENRLPSSGWQGLASRPRDGDSVQGNSAGEHRQRKVGEVGWVHAAHTVCQSISYQYLCTRTGYVLSQPHSHFRLVLLWRFLAHINTLCCCYMSILSGWSVS